MADKKPNNFTTDINLNKNQIKNASDEKVEDLPTTKLFEGRRIFLTKDVEPSSPTAGDGIRAGTACVYHAGAGRDGWVKQLSDVDNKEIQQSIKDLQEKKLDIDQGEANKGLLMAIGENGKIAPSEPAINNIARKTVLDGEIARAKAAEEALDEKIDTHVVVSEDSAVGVPVANSIKVGDAIWNFGGSGGSGIVNWGAIQGTLANQTDLANALLAKQDTASLETDVANAGFTKNKGTVTKIKMNGTEEKTPDTNGVVDIGNVIRAHQDITGKQDKATLETDVAAKGFTKNIGTITGIKMNSSVKGTSGEVDLGTVITEHQSLDGLVPKTRKVNGHELSADVTVTKSDVELGNVDNTSDANKPVSTAQRNALDLKLDISAVKNDLTTGGEKNALSAQQGIVLLEKVNNISALGRFLSTWNCQTGLPMSDIPTTTYQRGDYYIIGDRYESPGTEYYNRRPNGTQYTRGTPSTTRENETVNVDNIYRYDGTNWILVTNIDKSMTWLQIAGNPLSNTDLATEFSKKLDLQTGSPDGNAYRLPYYFKKVESNDKIIVTAETITLDNNKTFAEYNMEVTGAVAQTDTDPGKAGLLTAADKKKLDATATSIALEDEITRAKAKEDALEAGKINKYGKPTGSTMDYRVPYHFEEPVQNPETVSATFHTLVLNDGTTGGDYTVSIPASKPTENKAGLLTKELYDKKLTVLGSPAPGVITYHIPYDFTQVVNKDYIQLKLNTVTLDNNATQIEFAEDRHRLKAAVIDSNPDKSSAGLYTKELADDKVSKKVTEDATHWSLIDNSVGQRGCVMQSYVNGAIVSFNTATEIGPEGLLGQIYAKDKDSNNGMRFEIYKDGIYYGKGVNSPPHDRLYEIATINDVQALSGTFRGNFDYYATVPPGETGKTTLMGYSGDKLLNDFAVVNSDETHNNKSTMYIYNGTEWKYEYTIDNKDCIMLLGKVPGTSQEYNLPYYFYTDVQAEKIVAHAKTVTLDNHFIQGDYTMDILPANIEENKSGLYSKTLAEKKVDRSVKDDNGATNSIDNQKAQMGCVMSTTLADGKTVISFNTASENGADGILGQVYAKDIMTGQGMRINFTKSGAYYGVGASTPIDEAHEIATLGTAIKRLPEEPFSHTEYKFPFHIEDPVQNENNITAKFHTLVLNDGVTRNQYTITLPAADFSGTAMKAGLYTKALADLKVSVADIVDNVTSTDIDKPLSANQGKLLDDRITNVTTIGRYLASWDCATGKPTTDPTSLPFKYKAGDYYVIGNLGTPLHNLMPNGDTYDGSQSTTYDPETPAAPELNNVYKYDGTVWTLIKTAFPKTVAFSTLSGNAKDNVSLKTELENLVVKNSAISSGTKCKITYDTKGLVTAGADLAATDIPSLASSKITAMTSYAKATSAGAIGTSDTLNVAVGKLEYKVDNPGASAKMTGYAIATSSGAIAATDTLNGAIAKLEYRLKQLEDANLVRYA